MRQIKITKQITGRDSYSMEKYLQEISKIRVLSPDEEASLAKKMKKGDSFAKEKVDIGKSSFCGIGCQTISESWFDIGRFD